MKRSIDVSSLGELTHELVAVPKSARLEVCIGDVTYGGMAEIESEPGCVRLHFEARKAAKAAPKAKARSKK
jgi:hypothetical protein|tara:strand:- start:687 stop:899 length:213 start_codon:yes stop_codon:yes gene_type:complete